MITEKAELILHPIRMRIIQALAGQQLTPAQIGDILKDVPQASLYRHLKKLVDGGIVGVVGEKQVRGAVEKAYAMSNPMAANLTPEDMNKLTTEEHMQLFLNFVAGLISDFANYLNNNEKIDALADGVGYRQVPLNLSDEEFVAMLTKINEALLPYLANPLTPERKRRVLASIVVPLGNFERNGEKNE
jgi:DNA-binding transcriptional ArsR family regulator